MTQIISRRNLLKAAPAALAAAAVAGIPHLARADVVAFRWFKNPTTNFTSSSGNFVQSNLPENPVFTKAYADTYMWAICAIDISMATPGTAFNCMMLDGTTDLLQVSIAAVNPGQIVVVNMTDIFSKSAISQGQHTFPIFVATTGGLTTWRTPFASFQLLEVTLPTVDYSEFRRSLHAQRMASSSLAAAAEPSA